MTRRRRLAFVLIMGSLAVGAVVAIVWGPRQVESGPTVVGGVERFGSPPAFSWPPRLDCPPRAGCPETPLALVATISLAEGESWVSRADGVLRMLCRRTGPDDQSCTISRDQLSVEHGEEAAVYMVR
ncbi:MAG: hypothetical protein ACKVUT_07035 [Gaiella sp.]